MTNTARKHEMTKERDDLVALCNAIEALAAAVFDMRHRGTDFVIQDRLLDELGNLDEHVDETTGPILSAARQRLRELVK